VHVGMGRHVKNISKYWEIPVRGLISGASEATPLVTFGQSVDKDKEQGVHNLGREPDTPYDLSFLAPICARHRSLPLEEDERLRALACVWVSD
jgi:hypothetical protein